jgi:hypothetical protein
LANSTAVSTPLARRTPLALEFGNVRPGLWYVFQQRHVLYVFHASQAAHFKQHFTCLSADATATRRAEQAYAEQRGDTLDDSAQHSSVTTTLDAEAAFEALRRRHEAEFLRSHRFHVRQRNVLFRGFGLSYRQLLALFFGNASYLTHPIPRRFSVRHVRIAVCFSLLPPLSLSLLHRCQ